MGTQFYRQISIRALAPLATSSLLVGLNARDETSCKSDEQLPKVEMSSFQESAKENDKSFHGLFPLKHLWKPQKEYPIWDNNWDGKEDKEGSKRHIRREGVTRHIILVRHGQYDETHKEDEKRILTELGRNQADLTGRRIEEMIKGIDEKFGPCAVKILRVSNMARAKETADIIAKHLPDVERASPDPLLNEGYPCHVIPGGAATETALYRYEDGHPRIEKAFKTYFYRAPFPPKHNNDVDTTSEAPNPQEEKKEELATHPKHEFEIIVCHANVVRYFFCRALQLPPEAWLRLCTFNCSLTYLTVRPTGSVSCRMLGDIGHLGYANSTFSGHHGFNW